MNGFQAINVEAIRSDRVVCVINTEGLRVKAFQVFFGRDGSLFISFPYFRHRIGILSSAEMPADGAQESLVNLERGGKVTSHLVKYSHHPDGRAHFSQTGKIVTAIKRQSIALDTQHGHMFSLLIQGVGALDAADAVKDLGSSPKRSVIDFQVDHSEAIKFVGRWFDVSRMRFSQPTPTVGPTLPTIKPDGITRLGCMIASPYPNAKHVLLLTCDGVAKLGKAAEVFMFYGGFDPGEVMTDATRAGGFLAFLYPVPEADQVEERVGTVDYAPKGKGL